MLLQRFVTVQSSGCSHSPILPVRVPAWSEPHHLRGQWFDHLVITLTLCLACSIPKEGALVVPRQGWCCAPLVWPGTLKKGRLLGAFQWNHLYPNWHDT